MLTPKTTLVTALVVLSISTNAKGGKGCGHGHMRRGGRSRNKYDHRDNVPPRREEKLREGYVVRNGDTIRYEYYERRY